MTAEQIIQSNLERIEKEKNAFKILLGIQKKIGVERNLDKLLPLIIGEISQLIEADRSTLFLVDWDTLELSAKCAQELDEGEITIPLRMGIVGWAVLSKRVVNVANAAGHPYFNPQIDEIFGFKTESILVAPLMNEKNQVIGAIELINKRTGSFNLQDLSLILDSTGNIDRKQEMELTNVSYTQTIIENMIRQTDSECGSLFIIDNESGELRSIYVHGVENADINLSLKLGIAGLVAITGQVLNVENAEKDDRFDRSIDLKTGYETKSLFGVPLVNHLGESIGVLEVINKKQGRFDATDLEILEGLASILSIAVENAIMFNEHEKQYQSIMEVMAASIDAKDSLTAGHSIKVTQYAVGIARELDFTMPDIDIIKIASLLHDYGKLGVDDHVLKKPGKLTDDEYNHIKQHVTITRNILEKMYFAPKYRNVPMIASAHHEYIDGSGYDCGLERKDIPFMAKIITVADVFEALTADRHYRKAMPPEKAFEILEQGVGSKFDGNIVAALKRYWQGRDSEQ